MKQWWMDKLLRYLQQMSYENIIAVIQRRLNKWVTYKYKRRALEMKERMAERDRKRRAQNALRTGLSLGMYLDLLKPYE